MSEEWRQIPGLDGYEASTFGKIRNMRTGFILNPSRGKTGYLQMARREKTLLVHRLVAFAFLPNPDGLPQINHKNGIKSDNRIENLEWVTHADNLRHAYVTGLNRRRAVISDAEVLECRRLYSGGMSFGDIAIKMGRSYHAVWRCVRRKTANHI